jgi:hypothetical protein
MSRDTEFVFPFKLNKERQENPSEHRKPTLASRRHFAKSLFPAVLALQFVGAPEVEAQQKKQKRGRKERQRQTSPITIGGGSVSIDFNHSDFVNNGGVFVKANDEIDTIWVHDSNAELKWDLLNFVQGKDCVVTIHTLQGASNKDIVIKSKPGRALLSIEFEGGQFPLATGSIRRHFNPNRKIVGAIEVKDNSDGSIATFSVPSAGVCRIQIVNKF